jgi:hypothetical protein
MDTALYRHNSTAGLRANSCVVWKTGNRFFDDFTSTVAALIVQCPDVRVANQSREPKESAVVLSRLIRCRSVARP